MKGSKEHYLDKTGVQVVFYMHVVFCPNKQPFLRTKHNMHVSIICMLCFVCSFFNLFQTHKIKVQQNGSKHNMLVVLS